MTKIAHYLSATALAGAVFSTLPAQAFESTAKEAILVDLASHRVLYEKNADQRMPTSSMSKMMTIYMVFDALKAGKVKLDDMLTVSERAWRQTYKADESSMFLPLGSQVKIEDLIRGVVIQSGNDATVVLAEGLAGSEKQFVDEMNDKAKAIGMSNSHFMNSNGMPDPDHYSTARDLATLAEHIYTEFPEYYHYFGELEFTFNKIKQGNRNPLLYRQGLGVDGFKTGHTDAGGYGLTVSAKRGDRRLIAVVNGLPNMQARADDPAALLDYGFNEFRTFALFKPGDTLEHDKVWQGVQSTVPLVIDQAVDLTLNVQERKSLKVTVSMPQAVKAPIAAGQEIGKLTITVPGAEPREFPLKAAGSVERLGFFPRLAGNAHYMLGGGATETN